MPLATRPLYPSYQTPKNVPKINTLKGIKALDILCAILGFGFKNSSIGSVGEDSTMIPFCLARCSARSIGPKSLLRKAIINKNPSIKKL